MILVNGRRRTDSAFHVNFPDPFGTCIRTVMRYLSLTIMVKDKYIAMTRAIQMHNMAVSNWELAFPLVVLSDFINLNSCKIIKVIINL